MKITIFVSALSGGGAERVTCNLANHLADFNHEIEILTMGDSVAAEPLCKNVKCSPLLTNEERGNLFLNNIKRFLRLRRYVKTQMVDAYIVMLPIPTQLIAAFSHLTKAPIIMSERADPKVYSKRTQKNLKKACKKLDGAVFQTNEAKDYYESCLKATEGIIIPNAINPAFFRSKYEGDREKVIVGIGRLNNQKNFQLLISAFSRISEKFLDYKLVIYGKGVLLESLQNYAKEKGIGERVEFPGFATNMPEILEKASMFVLSSDYEGMPNALMEAMALGVPSVSTDCGGGGARFLIEHGVNGLLVPIRDEKKMAEAMMKILSDREFANMISQNARKIQKTLAPENIYGEWEKFILKKIEESRK